jgi:site-specific DNA-cytosine methylase
VLRGLGYQVRELELCPTALGVPMVRRRYYLLADRGGPVPEPVLRPVGRPLAAHLDGSVERGTHPELFASDELLARYGDNLPLVDPTEPDAVTHCFTGAYGRSPVYSGSWLVTPQGPRLLLPGEIARLLGFASSFRLPVPKRAKAYKLVGNALSVDVVRALVSVWYEEPGPEGRR